jgi:hypothetical protein
MTLNAVLVAVKRQLAERREIRPPVVEPTQHGADRRTNASTGVSKPREREHPATGRRRYCMCLERAARDVRDAIVVAE